MIRAQTILILVLVMCLAVTAHTAQNPKKRDKQTGTWTKADLVLWGMIAGTAVSLIGFVAAFLLLSLKKVVSYVVFNLILQVFFAFSCGALLGEVFIHILPEAY